MPAYDLTPRQAAIFGSIQRRVGERVTTEEIWNAVRAAYDRLNEPLPPGIFQAVNEMRSIAASLRLSSERLSEAERESPITSAMIGRTIYHRSATDPMAGHSYHVRFTVPRSIGNDTTMETYTFSYDGGLPATVGELEDDLSAYVDALSGDYGVAFGDVDRIEIGAY